MDILGINAHHAGASACLVRDGAIVAAAEEERFTRIKYCAGFPTRAIQYCLQEGGVSPYDLDHVGISRDPNAHLLKKVVYALRKRPSFALIRERLANRAEVTDLRAEFCARLEVDPASLRAEFHNVEHHLAHMASAFLVSPFREAAIASIDGFGDFVSTMTGVGRGSSIAAGDHVEFPHSLGIFFTAFTQWLGFPHFGDEGKVQGLAPYGQPRYVDRLMKVLRLGARGAFELDLDYFVHWAQGIDMTWSEGAPALGRIYSDRVLEEFGPARDPGGEITQTYRDMAASVQEALEQAELHLLRHLHRSTGCQALCLAGGVALNSSFNGKIRRQTSFTDVFIQPAAGDAGTALGVAFYLYNCVLGNPRRTVLTSAALGPAYSDREAADALAARGIRYETLDDEALVRRAAADIAAGRVVGWFQGRMEWGPRALGNRSILASPARADMKDILNARIKKRESFRPFAPSVTLEAVGDYFDQDYPEPFMLKVYGVLPDRRSRLPAVTHVDGTGRVQTVARDANPLFWTLLRQLGEDTGDPVALNTSFNENEPIVCSPSEAVDCFERTRMDTLVIGHHVACKDG